MSVVQRYGISFEQSSATDALRTAGRVAGALTLAVVVFASLYFFLLYLAAD